MFIGDTNCACGHTFNRRLTLILFCVVIVIESRTSSVFQQGLTLHGQNRAEAAVRVFKETLHDLCSQVGKAPELKQVTVRELLRKTAVVRISMVTFGGKKLLLSSSLVENHVML